MNPLLSGLLTGGASLLGSIFTSQTSAANTQAQIAAQEQMQTQTEDFNAGQAQINRDYQTEMSNTAYQRASQDMQKAGLNPAMMFGSGGAASAPSGSTAAVGTPSVPVSQAKGTMSGIGDAVNSAVNGMISAKTMDRLTEETARTISERKVADAREQAIQQERDESASRTGLNRQTIGIRGPQEAESQAIQNDLGKWVGTAGKVKYLAGTASDILQPIVSSAGGVTRIMEGFNAMKHRDANFIGRYGTPIDEYVAQ